jgi:hypothetical protein
MAIENTDLVDAIGVDNSTGNVILTIIDDMEWGGNDHLIILQEKINSYLRFIESGEIIESYPDAMGRENLIGVMCKYPPDEEGADFLRRVANVVEDAGIRFTYQVFDSG